MRIQSPDPKPRSEGDYMVDPTPGYGKPTADIWLDEKGELRLLWLDEGDCERLIRAAAEALKDIRRYASQMAAPHGRARIYQGTCQLCGKPEDDELHAEVITDSERTCPEVNPDGDWPCHRGGDHGVHRDANGGEWRTDLDAPGCDSYSLKGDGCIATESHWLHRDKAGHKWLSPESDPGGPEADDDESGEDATVAIAESSQAERAAATEFTTSSMPGHTSARCLRPRQHSDELDGAVVDCDVAEHHTPVTDDGRTYSDEPASVTA